MFLSSGEACSKSPFGPWVCAPGNPVKSNPEITPVGRSRLSRQTEKPAAGHVFR
jgi:hypothetical protein